MPTPQFYPALSKLIRSDKLPEPIKSVVDNTTDKLFYKTYYVEKSLYGETAYHHIVLVFNKEIGFNLFGGEEGFELLFNPGSAENTTELPLAIYYNLPIVKYIKQIQLGDLNSIEDYFNLLLEMFNVSKEELLYELVYGFLGDETDPFLAFVDDFNNNPDYNSLPPLTNPQETNDYEKITNLITQLQTRNLDLLVYTLENYVDIVDFSGGFENLSTIFKKWIGEFTLDTIIDLFIPKFSVTLPQLEVALAFPRKWLKPVDANGNVQDGKSMLTYNVGSMSYHSEHGFEFNQADSFDLTPSQIGNTGILIDIDNLKFDFRTDRNIPEATADGRPDEFRGFYAETVAITLPKKWFNNVNNSTIRVAGYNMLIGTGGVSGTIALETVALGGDGFMPVNIGNWELGFSSFDISLKQNAVIESNIEGRLKIPKLKNSDGNEALIGIKGHLNEEGDFNLTASEPQGIPLSLFDFMTINFLTLELGREDDNFYVGTSCEISFQNAIMERVLGDQKIVIPKLRVYEDGSIEIVGGNAFIPTNISLNLGPIEIAVTGIHFGSHQQEKNGVMRKYSYWGFDGAISLDPLGIDARGEGIKYYYTTDNDEHGGDGDSFLRIQTIEVDLIIPGTADPDNALAIINGMLSIPEPGESPEYEGKIGLKLPKARISGAAQMRLQPKEPAFIIEAGIEMPTPIPLAATGLAFYGFGGLLGYKYVAEKEAIGLVSGENTWYEYYTYPKRGVNLDKFSGPPRTDQYSLPVAVGAGTVLGTMHDDGFLFSTRLMAILSLPSVFILDGRANVLGERLGIIDDTEPPFFAGVAVGDNSFEFWFGADYQLPKSNGWIIDLYAEVQAGFFFNNPSAWYLNFGTKDSPITARVLTIITAQSYLMLSARGIEAGARVDLSLKKNFFGIKVEISAYVEVGGFISFERFQLGGYIAFGGTISISVWKIVGFRVSLDAILSAEAAKPFLLYAKVRIRVCIRIVFKICKTFKVKLKWEKDNSVDRTPIPALSDGSNPNYPDRTREAVQGVHMMTNETFELNYFANVPSAGSIDKVIPLDTYIDFKAMKGLVPGAISGKIGGHTGGANNFTDLIPPNKVVRGGHELRQVKHKYSIEDIEVKMWNGSSWQDYHPFEAVVPTAERDSVDHLRIGYWQRNGDQYDSIRLLATNPFSYMEAGEPGWFIPEEYGITPSELYCVTTQETGDCSDFLQKPLGSKYYRPNGYVGHFIDGAYYSIEEGGDDFEKTVYVLNTQWSIALSDDDGAYDEVYFDRIQLRKNGNNTFPNLGVNANIYTQENGVATNLTQISQQYFTAINTILSNNNGEESTNLKIKKVTVAEGNLIVDVQVESDIPFPNPDSDDMFFANLYLARERASGNGNSTEGSVSLSSKIVLTETDDSGPAGCLEVTDVENNFDYQQSLQFSNADRLVIILPQASVTTDLKLTTYSEGVTIRYYKTILSDTNGTPQYEEIHEVYKTKAALNSVVSYTNEDELTSKITVTPKSANAEEIRAIREEIAELQEAVYDSETGEIIPLTTGQQAELAALEDRLAQLEAAGCSVQSVTPKKRIVAEIYNEIDNDGVSEYRFRVFNAACEIVLSSSTRYDSIEAAVTELKTSVFTLLNESNSVEIKETVDQRFYFNIIDRKGEVIARRIEYFKTLKQCENEIARLKELLTASDLVIGENGCKPDASQPVLIPARTATPVAEAAIATSNTIFNSYKYYDASDSQRTNSYVKMRIIGGNCYAIGYPPLNVAGSNDNDGVLTKLDVLGKVMFSKVYYSEKSLPIRFSDIQELSDGNLLIIGRGDSARLYYLKVDTDGNVLWQRYFDCEQKMDEHRISVVKTRKRTFFISCISSRGDYLYILEIDESGEVINQTGLDNGGQYFYEVGASCLDPDEGLLIGIQRTDVKSGRVSSTIANFDSSLKLKFNYVINSKFEVKITDMIMDEGKLYFILDNISSSESTITYIPYNDKEFKEISSNKLPAYRNWKLTGSYRDKSVSVVNVETPIYNISIQGDESLAIDTEYEFNTPIDVAGIKDIFYDEELKKYTLVSSEYLAVLENDMDSCVTKKTEKITQLEERGFTYTELSPKIVDFGIKPVIINEIRPAEQNLKLEKELCPVDGGGNGDCEKDKILCEFYETLQTQLFACINYEAKEPFYDNWHCFLKMIESIENFDEQYPQYGLLEILEVDINNLIRYPEVARPPMLEGAINYANIILDKIFELGKCDCDGGGDEDPHICNTSIQQVCWLSVEKFEFNQTIPGIDAIEQEQEDMEEAVQLTAQPIWRPNSKFYVHYKLKDEVDNGENEGVFDYYYGFKTAGPVGHFHNADGVTYGNEYDEDTNAIINRVDENDNPTLSGNLTNPDSYPLTSLRQYIDYDRSYPNADGSLLQAKPVFYGQEQCRITLYFTKPLTYHMLRTWESYLGAPELTGSMHIAIKDPVSNVVIPYPLPTNFNEETVPLPITTATWLQIDSTVEIAIPEMVTIEDNMGLDLGTFDVTLSEYRSALQKQHIRINDTELHENPAVVGGKIIWEDPANPGVNIEHVIFATGVEDTTWVGDNDPRIPLNIRILNNFINYINTNNDAIECTFTVGNAIKPQSYAYSVVLTNLKPQKLYTALIYNAFETASNDVLSSEQVHNYVFQTSRYKNFGAQVNSYTLVDENDTENTRQAVFEVALPAVTTDNIATAYNIVVGNNDVDSDAIETQYLDVFDRVLEGVLGMTPLDPPVNTEFNKILDGDGNIIAVLIRNPEPFNIPKIPIEKINGTDEIFEENSSDGQRGTIRVINTANDQDDPAYKVLYSKDYSQALIMHQSQQITAVNLSFRFRYLIWNGSEYVIDDTARVDDISLI